MCRLLDGIWMGAKTFFAMGAEGCMSVHVTQLPLVRPCSPSTRATAAIPPCGREAKQANEFLPTCRASASPGTQGFPSANYSGP